MSKLRGGEWLPGRVVQLLGNGPMIKVEVENTIKSCNQYKLRRNPDPWRDFVVPGLTNRDGVPEVPERILEQAEKRLARVRNPGHDPENESDDEKSDDDK